MKTLLRANYHKKTKELLKDFLNIARDDLPNILPPIGNVKHAIDLGSTIIESASYWMNPTEHAKQTDK